MPAGRDRVTLYVIAAALAALLVVPWAASAALLRWCEPSPATLSLWPLITASLIALACAYKEIDRGTAAAAAFAVAWALGTALAAGPAGPSFGWARPSRSRL